MQGRLAALGDLVEDVVVWPQGALQRGTDTPARVFRARGGSAANVAAAAAALVPTRFLGCVGDDPLGDRLVAQLQAVGVDVRVQRRGRTGSIVVLVDVDGERTFLTDRAAAAELDDVDVSELDGVGVLHVPAYSLHGGRTATTARRLLDVARERGVAVSLDASSWAVLRAIGASSYRALVEQVRPLVLFVNADEARELDLPERPLPTTVLVKDGAQPTTVLHLDGSRSSVPVPAVPGVRDTTGAGDAFAAGWLAAMMSDADVTDCVERGHALARTVLLSPGAAAQEVS